MSRNVGGRPSLPKPDDHYAECFRHGRVIHRLYGKAIPRWKCRTCVAEAVTRRHRKMRLLLVEEAGGCCAVCGYDRCAWNLQFHHVDPWTKSFQMSMASGRAMAAYREEARKCVLLCANCHGEVEAGLMPSPPPRSRYRVARRKASATRG